MHAGKKSIDIWGLDFDNLREEHCMLLYDWLEILFFTGLFLSVTPLLGTYMADVLSGQGAYVRRLLGKLESLCYTWGGISPLEEMDWKEYGKALLFFNLAGFIFLFLLVMIQGYLPFNPQHFGAVSWDLAFNIASSFITNTNWQSYAGETTLSYFTQMIGITSQNFLSAASGMATLLVLTRGLVGKTTSLLGNFWVDLVRTVVYILLPLASLLALILVGEGVVQTFSPYVEVTTLENVKQVIPLGPAASQVAIKQLGTNGGGFFNANSTHPFENPTPLTNLLEMLAILIIPSASVYAYGMLTGSKKHAWILFSVMLLFWLGTSLMAFISDYTFNPLLDVYPVLEGQDTRIDATNGLLWTVSTTATSNGSVNAMISSLPPLVGGVALFNIMLGELIFGGVGVGLCSMIMFTLLTVFLSGLMVGKTPEYLGKKIEKKEMQWVMMAILTPGILILVGAGLACVLPYSLPSLSHQGPHGLSELLFAYASAAGNNGSAFAGLNANTPYFNISLGIIMLLGRIAIILPSLALAGLLASKKISPPSAGTFSTDSFLFFVLLTSVIFIVGALTFFPALSLGPIVEHLLMLKGQSF